MYISNLRYLPRRAYCIFCFLRSFTLLNCKAIRIVPNMITCCFFKNTSDGNTNLKNMLTFSDSPFLVWVNGYSGGNQVKFCSCRSFLIGIILRQVTSFHSFVLIFLLKTTEQTNAITVKKIVSTILNATSPGNMIDTNK
jgi:hypothetical protein